MQTDTNPAFRPKSSAALKLQTIRSFGLALALLFVAYFPSLRVPVHGDDFHLQFEALGRGEGNLWTWLGYNIHSSTQYGHFKPFGNVTDAIFQYAAYPLSDFLGIGTKYFFFIEGFLFLILTVLAASWFMREILTLFSLNSKFRYHTLVLALSAVTSLTLQLHPWSNDPVTTYITTGMGSAALSFTILALTVKATSNPNSRVVDTVLAIVFACIGLMYYEMILAVLPGQLVIIMYSVFGNSKTVAGTWKKLILRMLLYVGVPLGVFILGRVFSKLLDPRGGAYGGTVIELSVAGLRTLYNGFISILPGGAWKYSIDRLSTLTVTWTMLLLAAIAVILFSLAAARVARVAMKPLRWKNVWVPMLIMVSVALSAIASHAFTSKYIAEVSEPGLVYLFYFLGFMCVNVVLVGVVLTIPWKRLPLGIGFVALTLATSMMGLQIVMNTNLGNTSRSAYALNAKLSEAMTSPAYTEEMRCQALRMWSDISWPDYYRDLVRTNAPLAFQSINGKPFCKALDNQ